MIKNLLSQLIAHRFKRGRDLASSKNTQDTLNGKAIYRLVVPFTVTNANGVYELVANSGDLIGKQILAINGSVNVAGEWASIPFGNSTYDRGKVNTLTGDVFYLNSTVSAVGKNAYFVITFTE